MNIEDFVHKLNELFCSQTISIYSNANDTIMISVKYEDISLAITLPCNLKNIVNDKTKEDEYLEIVKRYVKELLRHVHNFYVESILCPL